MNRNRFKKLLNLYLEDKATERERDELMQMIQDGEGDELIRRQVDIMLMGRGHSDTMDPQRTKEILTGILEHGNDRGRIVPMKRERNSRQWFAAAAAILLVMVSVGLWLYNFSHDSNEPTPAMELSSEVMHTGKQLVHLPDGSTVLLHEGTKLSYARTFGENKREVTLVGEGYFDVEHDPSRPFKVLTGKVTTIVLGTTFNVSAYPGEEEIMVTVTRGTVQVNDEKRVLGIITHDQQIAVNTVTNDFVQRNIKAETSRAWQHQYLILDDVSLEEAATTIAEKYKVKIVFVNDDLKKCRISATFLNGENLDQVLTVVTGVVQASYSVETGSIVKIDGAGCK